MTFASIVMLRRFQSSGRMPAGGGISSGSGVGSVTGPPPRPAPTIEKPPRAARQGLDQRRVVVPRAETVRRAAARRAPVMRPSASSVTRYVLRSPSASETYTPVMPACGLLHPEQHACLARPGTAETGEEVDVLVRLAEHEPAALACPRPPDDFAGLCLPVRRAERRPSIQARAAEGGVGDELVGRPLSRQ